MSDLAASDAEILKVGAFVVVDIDQLHFSLVLNPALAAGAGKIVLSYPRAVEASMNLDPKMLYLYLHDASISSVLRSPTSCTIRAS